MKLFGSPIVRKKANAKYSVEWVSKVSNDSFYRGSFPLTYPFRSTRADETHLANSVAYKTLTLRKSETPSFPLLSKYLKVVWSAIKTTAWWFLERKVCC